MSKKLLGSDLLPKDLLPATPKQSERDESAGLSPVLATKDGERGRNRTYNLLIKSRRVK